MNRYSASLPLISVIMPVHNGISTIDRAVESLVDQSFDDWELLGIDDGSTDKSYERMSNWASKDRRIKIIRLEENRGPSVARNEGLNRASGVMITYLDCDDEYYRDYLNTVYQMREKCHVIISGYDIVDDSDPIKEMQRWDPSQYKDILFAGNLAAPLGIAHRRDWGINVGGFKEMLYGLEDWDFLKSLARAGAEFVFLPIQSGIYHIRESSRSRIPRLTERQRRHLERGRIERTSIYGKYTDRVAKRQIQKVLLTTPFFPFETYSSTANDLADVAVLLSQNAFACQGFCVSKLSISVDVNFEAFLTELDVPFQSQDTRLGPHAVRLIYTRWGSVPITILRAQTSRLSEYHNDEGRAFLDYYEKFLSVNQPEAIITCNPGPHPDLVIDLMFHVGKTRDVPVVLWLTDKSTINPLVLQSADYCVVTSESLRSRYWETLGLVCCVLPPAFDWDRVRLSSRDPSFVTIFNTNLLGESLFVTEIIAHLKQVRPDIPVIAGEPCGTLTTTKILLAPSLGLGTFDRKVAEAMINGIPVVASSRGALPEIVGDGGFLIDIPPTYKENSTFQPNVSDVKPWVEAVISLWDSPTLYDLGEKRGQEPLIQYINGS